MVQDADALDTNTVAETNEILNAGPDARARRLQRRSQNRSRNPGSLNRDARPGSGDTNNAASPFDYSAFRLITERNIFDPNRSPRAARPATQIRTVDSFSFVGTMSYEKGIFAFFDGTSSAYKKAVKPDDTIAGYKVVGISPDSVKLMHNTNVVELAVGTQMRRRDDGSWERSAASESSAAAPSSASASTSAPTGAESDVLKKLMMRREKE
jgi:hypothetical protein